MTLKENKGHIPSTIFFKLSFKRIHVQRLMHANKNWMPKQIHYLGVNYSNFCL